MGNDSKIIACNRQDVGEELSKIFLDQTLLVVSDHNTANAYGFSDTPPFACNAHHCYAASPQADMETALQLLEKARDFQAVLAVGSGTINDLCKYAACRAGIPYAVLASAPSMNGYVSGNASLTYEGYKQSFHAAPPVALLYDPQVLSDAPARLIASGVGDTLCLTTVINDAWLSHAVRHTAFDTDMFEPLNHRQSVLLKSFEARTTSGRIVPLMEALIAGGQAMRQAGSSHPASQGEHMIAHVLEILNPMLSKRRFHGEIIAVTTLTMLSLQEELRKNETGFFHFAPFPYEQIEESCGTAITERWQKEYTEKCIRPVDTLKISDIPPYGSLKGLNANTLKTILKKAGCPTSSEELGIDGNIYRKAVALASFSRDRLTWLDIAASNAALRG